MGLVYIAVDVFPARPLDKQVHFDIRIPRPIELPLKSWALFAITVAQLINAHFSLYGDRQSVPAAID